MSKSSMQRKPKKSTSNKAIKPDNNGVIDERWSDRSIAKNREAYKRKHCPWESQGLTKGEWLEAGFKKYKEKWGGRTEEAA
tara:strand:- start:2638 stop:2880 length:243 start_codon:yes stop_codon:yes gene_type:complete